MQKILFRCLLGTALACFFFSLYNGNPSLAADGPSDEGIAWLPYAKGLTVAKSQNKKIFIHFYTNRCHYCRVMQAQTFVNQNVIDMLNDNFVSIKVNLEENPGMGATYPVAGVPASWFLESNGDKIGVKPGFLPPAKFIQMLQFILDEKYKEYKNK